MKYPFSPEFLDAFPEELAELFRGLELTLLEEICSRFKIADNLNEVTVSDIKALRSHGIDLEEIKKAIAETTNTGMGKLNKLMDDVVERNQKYYTSVIDIAGVTKPDGLVDQKDVEAIRKQTVDEFHNITASMGFLVDSGRTMLPPAKAYQWALDSAALQIESGAFSYNEAVARAVKQLADSGLKTVSYESGHVDSADVAARRAVLTGVNQLNQKYREQSMDYLETDLVEVSAHQGARDIDGPLGWENHKAWQGKVYQWKGHAKSNSNKDTISAEDVTNEYFKSAAPGKGAITCDDGYEKQTHSEEIKTAEWLRKTFGGAIRLLKESTQKSVKTADAIWKGNLWEFKHTRSISGADKRLEYALKQIENNPGGVVLNMKESVSLGMLEKQLLNRFTRSKIYGFDLILLEKGRLIKIMRYKK